MFVAARTTAYSAARRESPKLGEDRRVRVLSMGGGTACPLAVLAPQNPEAIEHSQPLLLRLLFAAMLPTTRATNPAVCIAAAK